MPVWYNRCTESEFTAIHQTHQSTESRRGQQGEAKAASHAPRLLAAKNRNQNYGFQQSDIRYSGKKSLTPLLVPRTPGLLFSDNLPSFTSLLCGSIQHLKTIPNFASCLHKQYFTKPKSPFTSLDQTNKFVTAVSRLGGRSSGVKVVGIVEQQCQSIQQPFSQTIIITHFFSFTFT